MEIKLSTELEIETADIGQLQTILGDIPISEAIPTLTANREPFENNSELKNLTRQTESKKWKVLVCSEGDVLLNPPDDPDEEIDLEINSSTYHILNPEPLSQKQIKETINFLSNRGLIPKNQITEVTNKVLDQSGKKERKTRKRKVENNNRGVPIVDVQPIKILADNNFEYELVSEVQKLRRDLSFEFELLTASVIERQKLETVYKMVIRDNFVNNGQRSTRYQKAFSLSISTITSSSHAPAPRIKKDLVRTTGEFHNHRVPEIQPDTPECLLVADSNGELALLMMLEQKIGSSKDSVRKHIQAQKSLGAIAGLMADKLTKHYLISDEYWSRQV